MQQRGAANLSSALRVFVLKEKARRERRGEPLRFYQMRGSYAARILVTPPTGAASCVALMKARRIGLMMNSAESAARILSATATMNTADQP